MLEYIPPKLEVTIFDTDTVGSSVPDVILPEDDILDGSV